MTTPHPEGKTLEEIIEVLSDLSIAISGSCDDVDIIEKDLEKARNEALHAIHNELMSRLPIEFYKAIIEFYKAISEFTRVKN